MGMQPSQLFALQECHPNIHTDSHPLLLNPLGFGAVHQLNPTAHALLYACYLYSSHASPEELWLVQVAADLIAAPALVLASISMRAA